MIVIRHGTVIDGSGARARLADVVLRDGDDVPEGHRDHRQDDDERHPLHCRGREGVHEYDMGPGENPYKARWASGARETIQLRVFRRGLYGAMLHGLETQVVPALRRLLDRGAR